MYFKLIHLHYRHTHFLFKLKSLLHRGKHTHNMVSSVGRINGSRWEGLEEDCLFWRIRCIPKAQIGAECSVILGIWFSFTLCPYPLETVMDKWKERILIKSMHDSCFSHFQLFAARRTVARQAPLSMGFSRQEHWSGLPCPSPRNLPNPGIELESLMPPALAGSSLPIIKSKST